MHKLDQQYYNLVRNILEDGIEENNQRTHSKIKVLLHRSISYKIGYKIPILGCRKIYPHVAAAEMAWACTGEQNTKFITEYSKMWKKFEDVPNKVIPAYGYRWRKYFGRDQIKDAINTLKKDKSNRQVWITAWDAGKDGLGSKIKYKNIPCPIGFSLNILNKKLNMSVYLRSSDVIVGLPYDILFYSFLLVAISKSLDIISNQITFYLNHAHIYKSHYQIAEKIKKEYEYYKKTKKIKEEGIISFFIPTSNKIIKDIEINPKEYVEEIKNISKERRPHIKQYTPEIEAIL